MSFHVCTLSARYLIVLVNTCYPLVVCFVELVEEHKWGHLDPPFDPSESQ